VLDVWEKFGYTPMEWDNIDKQTQLELIAKRNLDEEHNRYLKEKAMSDN